MLIFKFIILIPIFTFIDSQFTCTCNSCIECNNEKCCSYCDLEKDPTACNKKPHIACPCTKDKKLPPMDPSTECRNKAMIPITSNLKDLLVREHNNWRNLLAQGAIPEYPTATKMMKMHWNDELAEVAWVHANHCVFEHDKCRATMDYKKSGQNLALKLYSRPYNNYEKMIKEMCAEWFEEYKLLPKDRIHEIISKYEHKDEWGHFAVMAREKNEALGCALVSMENIVMNPKVPHHYMLTCHYADANFQGATLYDHGNPCSRCDVYGQDFKCDKQDYHRLCDNITSVNNGSQNGKDQGNINIKRFNKCHEMSHASKISLAQSLTLTLILMTFITVFLT